MRLALFTPLPPIRSGISAYSAELLPSLAAGNEIEVFVDDRRVALNAQAQQLNDVCPAIMVCSAHDFPWKYFRRPYDLVIYQMGNAECHDYMWPYLHRYPGLVVLHDAQLHHARARSLLWQRRSDDYRAEFAYNHPRVKADLAEYAVAGLGGPIYYLWPMLRTVMESAKLVAVHNARVADQLRNTFPGTPVDTISMGVADLSKSGTENPAPNATGRSDLEDRNTETGSCMPELDVRARHGIPRDVVVFAAFGMVTPEKRVSQALRALAATLCVAPDAHLLFVGETAAYFDALKEVRAAGVADHVTVTGFVPDSELGAYLRTADVALCLRWPTSRETSASWLRCLAAGKPTLTTDLIQTVDVPTLDPRTWTVLHASDDTGDEPQPVSISIDIVDEDHSLKHACRRLAVDAALRQELGRAARAFWEREHTIDRMVADYRTAIAHAHACPTPARATLPAHLLDDQTAHARGMLEEFEIAVDMLDRG